MEQKPLSPEGFEALRDAVRVARDQQVRSVKRLRALLAGLGHQAAHINEALTCWASYARSHPSV